MASTSHMLNVHMMILKVIVELCSQYQFVMQNLTVDCHLMMVPLSNLSCIYEQLTLLNNR